LYPKGTNKPPDTRKGAFFEKKRKNRPGKKRRINAKCNLIYDLDNAIDSITKCTRSQIRSIAPPRAN
jgi:hypothetical protein